MNVQRNDASTIRRFGSIIKMASTGACDCLISRIRVSYTLAGSTVGIVGAGGCTAPDCLDCGCFERTVGGSFEFKWIKQNPTPFPPEDWPEGIGYFQDCCNFPNVTVAPYDPDGHPFGTDCLHIFLKAPCNPDPRYENRAPPGVGASFFEVFHGFSLTNGVAIDANYSVGCSRHDLDTDTYSAYSAEPTVNGSFTDQSGGPVDRLSDLIGGYSFEKHITNSSSCFSSDYLFTVDIDVS